DIPRSYYPVTLFTDYDEEIFHLKGFLNFNNVPRADCGDMTNFLSVLAKSQGINLRVQKICSLEGYDIFAKYVRPIANGYVGGELLLMDATVFLNEDENPEMPGRDTYGHHWIQSRWNAHYLGVLEDVTDLLFEPTFKRKLDQPPDCGNLEGVFNQQNATMEIAQNCGFTYQSDDYGDSASSFITGMDPPTYLSNLIYNYQGELSNGTEIYFTHGASLDRIVDFDISSK
ncbi:MAG: hypothetical protein J7M18_04410, partial [Candidatus Eremiobacteraeota bacterium]|nr:hypothetical protein [Candidatus Eremiobacteraeota bacterium]